MKIMKRKRMWAALWMLLAAMGQMGTFAQEISIDMKKDYPEKSVSLQEVAEVKYIPLGTTDDALFNGTIVNLSAEGIAGFNPKQGDIMLFDGNGKVTASFNHLGQGPNEYPQIYHLDVDWHRKEIYVQDNLREKVRIYASDGKYLRTVPTKGTMKKNSLFHFSDTHLVYYMQPASRSFSPYRPVTLMSKKDGTTATLPFTKKGNENVKATGGPFGDMKMMAKEVGSLYKMGNDVYVNEVTDDMIYVMESATGLKPVVRRTPSWQEPAGKDFFLVLQGVNARYYFFKRQEALLYFKGNAATETQSTYVAYDRRNKEVSRLSFTNGDYPSLDIPLSKLMQCAGAPNRCFFLLEAFKLKEALEEGKLKGALKGIAEKLDEEDNPVLMVVEFRK